MNVTKNLADYIRNKGIAISVIARSTGLPYQPLYDSLANKSRERSLSADEAVLICKFLEKDLMEFAEKKEGE